MVVMFYHNYIYTLQLAYIYLKFVIVVEWNHYQEILPILKKFLEYENTTALTHAISLFVINLVTGSVHNLILNVDDFDGFK